jgi:sulfide dehydrogenase cytochrome subunit
VLVIIDVYISIIMHNISRFNALILISIIGLFSPMIVFADASTQAQDSSNSAAKRQLHTRSLAATCAACHSTHQNNPSLPASIHMPLYGMDSTYFISQMLAFKSGERASTVMQRHAKGLTADEISDLSAYFAVQKLGDVRALPQQKLLKTHPH